MAFEALKIRLQEYEGSESFMYLDTRGKVTTGVGHLLATVKDAQNLPWRRFTAPATPEAIAAEYAAVLTFYPGMNPHYYEERTALRLSDASVGLLLDMDVDDKFGDLTKNVVGFTSFPEPVWEALLDMAFNLGVSGLEREFPHMMAAVLQRDWLRCAENCHRAGIAERNDATAALFRSAAVVVTA